MPVCLKIMQAKVINLRENTIAYLEGVLILAL